MEFIHNIPIYLQVMQDIKRDIVNGTMPMGEKMPSSRELAIKYKINPNTASRIYKELELELVCFTKRGLGTYVTEDKEIIFRIREEMAQEFISNFIAGMKGLGYKKEELRQIIAERYGEEE